MMHMAMLEIKINNSIIVYTTYIEAGKYLLLVFHSFQRFNNRLLNIHTLAIETSNNSLKS